MDYRWSGLNGIDVERWSALTYAVVAVDGGNETYRPEDLAEELESLDPDLDGVAVHHGDELVAVGTVRVRDATSQGFAPVIIDGSVAPEHRGRGVGRELLTRLERRGEQLAASVHPGVPVRLVTHAAEQAPEERDLLQRRGYVLSRWFAELDLDLREWTPSPPDPRVRPLSEVADRAVHAAHCAAFADHWGSVPPGEREWAIWYTGARAFRPAVSCVVSGPDGLVRAYALLYEYAEAEIYVGQVGVRPEDQKQGLGRATLTDALAAAKAAGYVRSSIGVDSENAHDAGSLYERIGFHVTSRHSAYLRDLG